MARRRYPTFYPPGHSRLADRLGAWLVLPLIKRLWRIGQVEFAADDAERLRAACAGPAVLCPNHPSLHEPVVVWEVLERLRLRRHFAMALDTMRVMHAGAWFLQKLGCFSIKRGAPDRPAFALIRELLADGRTVVLFPEGETSGLGDRLIPFRDGMAQLGFWGLQERLKQERSPECRLVPIAVKYYYDQDMTGVIDAALERLEGRLGIADGASCERYERLRAIGFATARALEREYDLTLPDGASLDEHIEAILGHIVDHVATSLEVTIDPGETTPANLRRLFATVTRELYESDAPSTPYEESLREQREPAWKAFERELARLQTFQAVRDGYVAAHPSAERYLDVLGRLERDVIGEQPIYARRRVVVRVGEPVDLGPRLADYDQDRRAAVAAATEEVRARLQTMLESLGEAAPTI